MKILITIMCILILALFIFSGCTTTNMDYNSQQGGNGNLNPDAQQDSNPDSKENIPEPPALPE